MKVETAQEKMERVLRKAQGATGNRHQNLQLPSNDGWSKGFKSEDEMYEWLVDCYRMRLDDDYAWGGGKLRGLYDPDNLKKDIVADIVVFAKLAHLSGCLPRNGWRWDRFLQKAKSLVMYAFEKEDAKEKYGGENVFNTIMGGRSLRQTGEVIYSSGVMEQGQSPVYETVNNEVAVVFQTANPFHPSNQRLFADIGGISIWKNFHNDLELLDR